MEEGNGVCAAGPGILGYGVCVSCAWSIERRTGVRRGPGDVFSMFEDTADLKGFRKKMILLDWMQNVEKAVEGSPKGRKWIAAMRITIERMRK